MRAVHHTGGQKEKRNGWEGGRMSDLKVLIMDPNNPLGRIAGKGMEEQ